MGYEGDVAYLGPETTFSHVAAQELFPSAQFRACESFAEVIALVAEQGIRGVVPISNVSMAGPVDEVPRLLVENEVFAIAAKEVGVRHFLLGPEGFGDSLPTQLSGIRKVYSKREVFLQCDAWLKTNLPNAVREPAASTAESAAQVSRLNDPSVVAIATELASWHYDLVVLARDIQDAEDNRTRFYALGPEPVVEINRAAKSLLAWKVSNQCGALHLATGPFFYHGINMADLHLVNLDHGGPKTFICEFEGHFAEDKVQVALEAMGKQCSWMKELGSYLDLTNGD